jgi:hypothetical protein
LADWPPPIPWLRREWKFWCWNAGIIRSQDVRGAALRKPSARIIPRPMKKAPLERFIAREGVTMMAASDRQHQL